MSYLERMWEMQPNPSVACRAWHEIALFLQAKFISLQPFNIIPTLWAVLLKAVIFSSTLQNTDHWKRITWQILRALSELEVSAVGVGISFCLEGREENWRILFYTIFSINLEFEEWLGKGYNLQLTVGGHKEKTGCNVGEKGVSNRSFWNTIC